MAAELQTITAAITVTQLAWNTCVFFRNVQNADETARRLYQKTRRLHRILQDIRAVLERRQDHRQKNPTLPTEAQTESNINASLDAIKEVLLKIERKIQVLGSSEQLSRSSNAVARLKLTLKQPAIARHESDLETQIQALQISLSALQLFGQTDTQSQLQVNHDEILFRLAKLSTAIRLANSRLLSLSRENHGEQRVFDVASNASTEVEESEEADAVNGVQTLRRCIGTAETVRDTFESAYDPDGESLARFSDGVQRETYDDNAYNNDELDDLQPNDVADTGGGEVGLGQLDGHDHLDHDDSTPLEVISLLIKDLRMHALNDLQAGNHKRAEVHLVEAINHAEEREAKHGVPFDDRVELQETLAIIYQKQKKWAEARKILHGLLQEASNAQPELAVEKTLRRSNQYLLLATIHHEMHLAQPNQLNPSEAADLQSAERYAKLAFNKRYKLLNTGGQRDPGLLDAVQILIQVYEAQGRTVLAESYHRQFMSSRNLTTPLPDDLLQTLSISTGSDFDVIEIDELLISAIRQGDHSHIQSLLGTADLNKCIKGKTPLMHAVEQGEEVTIRKLLDHGAEINGKTESETTALHHAVAKGNVRMARLLLELDADIEAKDKNLATPLVRAVEKNQGLVVSYLLGQGADRHVKDRAGWTPLHHAAHNGAVDILKHLLYPSDEASVNATCPARKTALHYCAELTLIEPAKVLLAHGADVNALDANKRSPLFFAVQKPFNTERERFLNLLLDSGAEVDPARLPMRQRDYPALQAHLSEGNTGDSSSTRRRGSSSTVATSKTGRSLWPRRFSLNKQ